MSSTPATPAGAGATDRPVEGVVGPGRGRGRRSGLADPEAGDWSGGKGPHVTAAGTAPAGVIESFPLLERSEQLGLLDGVLEGLSTEASGHLVLVRGEAGAGKSALVRRFAEEHGASARILWGACDPLLTPRPLGPLVDVARDTGGDLEALVEVGAIPHDVLSALIREVERSPPTVVVLEDLHWADEATLDVLRLLGRRVTGVASLVIATYRDDELDRAHPLRIVLGELATSPGIERLAVGPLSPMAVAELAAPHHIDAVALHHATGGNPFFVSEVLMSGTEEIPATVRDAVLARAARLSDPARELFEALTVTPPEAELGLLEAIAGGHATRLDECLASGMLVGAKRGVSFRHELVRRVVEESLPPHRRVALHARALQALVESPVTSDPALLADHAEAAGDAEAVRHFAPIAAARASALGAHRESAAQYARALRFSDALPPERRAELLELRAHECILTDQNDEAIEALEEAIPIRRRLGDVHAEGAGRLTLSRALWCPGRVAESKQAARDAVEALERLEPGRTLASAYSRLSDLCVNRLDEAVAWGDRAVELAQTLDDAETVLDARTNIGAAMFLHGAPGGREQLERCVELATEAELHDIAGHATVNLVWIASIPVFLRARGPVPRAGARACRRAWAGAVAVLPPELSGADAAGHGPMAG